MKALSLFLCAALTLLGSKALAQPPRLTIEVLRNSQYRIDNETIKLKNGKYLRKTPDDFMDARLSKVAFGDLDNDGMEDAAVLLIYSGGGSGSFYLLFAVINKNGTPYNAASTLLGDRVVVQSFNIKSGRISIDMITHGPDDPSCCPTLKEVIRYKLAGGNLVEE